MSDMPQRNALPPAPDHEHHDAMLVAQLVAGDKLDATEQAKAQRLVTGCGACAALAADLRVVSVAVAQEPVPPRRRDFRLSPEQAEELSGNALTRFLRGFSLPSARAFQPAAAGVLSIGLVFVIAGSVWPDGGTITVQSAPNYVDWSPSAPASVPIEPDAVAVPSPVVLEEGLNDVAALEELEVVDDLAAARVDEADVADELAAEGVEGVEAEFFETLPESQAGDLDRMSQKSMAGEAELSEEVTLPRAADAPAADADAAAGAADADAADADAAGAVDADADAADAEADDADAEAGAAAPEAPTTTSTGEDRGTSDSLDAAAALDAAAEDPSVEQELGAVAPGSEAEADAAEVGAPAAEAVLAPAEDDGLDDLLLVIGGLLVLAGGGLLALGWLARRARDPLAP